MKNKIYILMATYNGEKFISEQIDSLLNQTYQNWKLFIHDDNSKDRTIEIIKEYENKYPNKIQFLDDNISTGGAKENFTYLLNNIDEDYNYIMFCDQDDVWIEDKIELTLNKMVEVEKENIDKPILIHTDLKVVDEKLNIISESMFNYQKLNLNNQYDINKISIENVITGCTMMLNKSLVKMTKYIPKEAIMHDWWIAIVTLKNNGIIEFVDKSTINYRQHSINTIGAKRVDFLYYAKKILKIKMAIKNYLSIINQYERANINISIFNFTLNKFIMIINKIYHYEF